MIATAFFTMIFLSVICIDAMELPPPKPDEGVVTLVLKKSAKNNNGTVALHSYEYTVPKDIMAQFKTVDSMADDLKLGSMIEINEELDPASMGQIAQMMWSLHIHKDLKGKALLSMMENEVPIFPSHVFNFLNTANLLDFQPAIEFCANIIPRAPELLKKIKLDIKGKHKNSLVLPPEMLKRVAWYYKLYHFKELNGVDKSIYSYSIQDYIDFAGIYVDPIRLKILGKVSVKLTDMSLTSLEGLKNIPNIAATQRLFLQNNKLTHIDKDTFRCLPNLVSLHLENNQLTRLDPETLTHLQRLKSLAIGQNRLTQENKDELREAVRLFHD